MRLFRYFKLMTLNELHVLFVHVFYYLFVCFYRVRNQLMPH